MGSDFEAEYFPQSNKAEDYGELMEAYIKLGAFVEQITNDKK